jgi:hypothetical protein
MLHAHDESWALLHTRLRHAMSASAWGRRARAVHVDAVRADAHQQVGARARAQLALDGHEPVGRLRRKILGETRDDELVVVLHRVGFGDDASEPRLRHLVVGAVHEQHRVEASRAELLLVVDGAQHEALCVAREVAAVGVGAVEIFGANTRAVGSLPPECGLLDRFRDAAPRDRMLHAREPDQLRHLRYVAEHVGEVADLHRAAELGTASEAELQVAHHGLARDHELVHQDHPRPDGEPARRREALQRCTRVRPHLQIVVDDDGLAVEHEARVRRVRLEDRQQCVEKLDETQTERLERVVPLAVPMRVRDDCNSDRRSVAHLLIFA